MYKSIIELANDAILVFDERYNVEFATNGKQAIQWVQEHIFDLVLLDIMMPEISGFEVCEAIRKIEAYNDIPVIFLTAKITGYPEIIP